MQKEVRVAVIGTRGSGKTTLLGLKCLTASDLALKDKGFKFGLEEETMGIRQVPSLLMDGRFPQATPPGIFEAELVFERKKFFGSQKVRLLFVDIAGETLQRIIARFSLGLYSIEELPGVKEIHEYILHSSGYIIVVPVVRLLGLEEEPGGLPKDPDVNTARFIDAIVKFKKNNPKSPEIQGVAIVFTKYDLVRYFLALQGMNLANAEELQRFVSTYLPLTYSAIKSSGVHNVKYLYSGVEIEVDKNGNPICHEDGWGAKIRVDRKTRRPFYSKDQYIALIDWIMKVFS